MSYPKDFEYLNTGWIPCNDYCACVNKTNTYQRVVPEMKLEKAVGIAEGRQASDGLRESSKERQISFKVKAAVSAGGNDDMLGYGTFPTLVSILITTTMTTRAPHQRTSQRLRLLNYICATSEYPCSKRPTLIYLSSGCFTVGQYPCLVMRVLALIGDSYFKNLQSIRALYQLGVHGISGR